MKSTALYAALLSLTEIGLGSVLHTFHIPFTGQFLSLNQIAILSRATTHESPKTTPMEISTIAVVLKSLSPMGKKLTPMLAIIMQGLLFNLGTLIGGSNVIGRSLGGALSSLWGFIQPVLIYTLIFGESIWLAVSKASEKMLPEGMLLHTILYIIGTKCLIAIIVVIYAQKLPLLTFERFAKPLQLPPKPANNIFLSALKDLFRPLFLISLGCVIVVFYFTEMPSDLLLWAVLRPLASGYLFFIALRIMPLNKLITSIERRGETRFSGSLREALNYVQERSSRTSSSSPTESLPSDL